MKHVIFLGAGASRSSGYPLASDLRKTWLVSSEVLLSRLIEAFPQELDMGQRNELVTRFHQWIRPAEASLKLFRKGCFGSIDEFCNLVRGSRSEDVQYLKKVLRFVFGLHQPELKFIQSDYYAFIQRLFDTRDLSRLRDDITILTFNYDPYLDWLLRTAYQTRVDAIGQLNHRGLVLDGAMDASLTSGFSGGRTGLAGMLEGNGFCFLKLHGTVAWPNDARNEILARMEPHCSHGDFFSASAMQRFSSIMSDETPPIVFPWEVFRSSGELEEEEDRFVLRDQIIEHRNVVGRRGGRGAEDPSIHETYKAIWTRARRDVLKATRISFVGTSMHDYLNVGFKHLFNTALGAVTVSITDEENVGNSNQNSFRPRTPAYRLMTMREQICPQLGFQITVRRDFEDFISKDL